MSEGEQPRPIKSEPPKRRRPPVTDQSLLENASWMPARYELADISAVQAVARGDADSNQQRRALDWIIRQACATYDWPFRPNSARDTDVALGRQFVGQQIVKLLHLNPGGLRGRNPNADPPEPRG